MTRCKPRGAAWDAWVGITIGLAIAVLVCVLATVLGVARP